MSLGRRLPLRHVLSLLVATVAVSGALSLTTAAAAQATPIPMTALILGSTVSPYSSTDGRPPDNDPASLEEQQAQADGFTVTVVDDATWKSMTPADFAQYQLIILGDPANCSTDTVGTNSTANTTASAWEPVVMNSGGNKVLIGSNPTYHYFVDGTAPDAPILERNSLAYAGAVSGATGVYLDLGCSYDHAVAGTQVPILDGLSTHGAGQFTAVGYNPINACATNVDIVASTGPTSGLTDQNLSNWNCSVHEAFDTFPSDYTPMAVAPQSSGFPSVYCALDVHTNAQACGSPYIMVSGGGVSVTSNISLSPVSQKIPTSASNSATVTATVTSGGTPEAGKSVTFNVDTGPNTGKTHTAVTDANGHASFTYFDSGVSGTDSVSASFVDDQNNTEKALSSVTWVGPINGDDFISAAANDLSGSEGVSLGSPTVATFSDSDGDSPNSDWTATVDWGDGSTSPGTITGSGPSFGVTAHHTYAQPGSYPVQVTITDTDNPQNTTTVAATATITEGQLGVQATNLSAAEGSQFSGQVATLTDSDLGTLPANYTATVAWGDGHTSPGVLTAVSGHAGSFTVGASHTYAEAGSYSTSVTVSENDAPTNSASAGATATVTEGAITVTAQAIAPTEGHAFTGAVATFTDGNPGASAGDYTATVHWGDGNTSSGTITGSAGNFSVSAGHTYAEAGSYPVGVSVVETSDSTSGSGSATGTVAEAPIAVTAKTIAPTLHVPFTGAVATFSDGDPLTGAGAYTATIDWGDGSITPGTVSGSAGSFTVTGGHTYSSIGSDPISVTVQETDDASAGGSNGGTATVGDAALSVRGRGTLVLPTESFSGTIATFSYGNPSAPAGAFTASVRWGDGATGAATISGSGGSFSVVSAHTFAGQGPYTATITVSDTAATHASATTTISIPSSSSSLAVPHKLSARKLLCGVTRHGKCPGLKIQGIFGGPGSATWRLSLGKAKAGRMAGVKALATVTRQITSSGATVLLFKVTPAGKAKRLYKLIKKHRINTLVIEQAYTNSVGAGSSTGAQVTLTR